MSPDDPQAIELVKLVRQIFREFSTPQDRNKAIESRILPVHQGFAKNLCRRMEQSDARKDRMTGQTDSLQAKEARQPMVGKYLLVRILGEGGMGQVWLALDTVTGTYVALKVLPEAFRTNPDEQERLIKSFRGVQALPPHPAICRLQYIDHDQALGYYLVMDYVDGVTLSKYRYDYELAHGSFSISELVHILDIAGDALDHAHYYGMIHRDIKPSNILISHDGKHVTVIDFQLAWEIRTATSRLIRERVQDNPGTYCYMAPELWLGQRASPRSDQYALAMLAFELLDGHLPFEATTESSWRLIVTDPNTRIPSNAGLPAYAHNALARALHFDPDKRFDTCRQFAEALAGRDSRETENFFRWKETATARDWVVAKNGSWDHQDWVLLLESVRRSEFWPMREADVGQLLNQLRNDLQSQKEQTRNEQNRMDDTIFPDDDMPPTCDPAIGTQVNVDGYPPLSDELLAVEVEFHRQISLLKQVEDGIHPVLDGAREKLAAAQSEFDTLSKEYARNLPQAAPGILESITETISQNPELPFSELSKIAGDLSSDELYGFVQRVRRSVEAKKQLQNAQKQILIDRQALATKLRAQKEETHTCLKKLQDADFNSVCRSLFDRACSANASFPTEFIIKELPNIRLRRYGWTDQQIMDLAEETFIKHRDDLAFETALAESGITALTNYVSKYPPGRHCDDAKSAINARREEYLWDIVKEKKDRRSCRTYLAEISASPRRAIVERRLQERETTARRANAINQGLAFGIGGAVVGGIVGAVLPFVVVAVGVFIVLGVIGLCMK